MRRFRRWLLRALAALILVLLIALASAWLLLRGSLPRLDGEQGVEGLAAEVRIERDGNGVPSLHAQSLLDLDRALGFLHAQDRFFQMDLLRRAAAGELAELFGPRALSVDRARRHHDFRRLARAALRAESPELRARVEAYAAGVEAGREALRARPFEYWLLRQEPRAWLPEDSYLVLFAMFLDLQSAENRLDLARARVRERIPELADFLLVEATPWDAPLDGGEAGWPPLPALAHPGTGDSRVGEAPPDNGSNAFALGSSRTRDDAALLASDMHLGLRIPNIWYRAHMHWPEGVAHGLTLPGAPGLVAGSNGHLAWSFTNSYADAVDWVELEPGEARAARQEEIPIAGTPADSFEIRETRFGPVYGDRALAWVAQERGGANLNLLEMMEATRLEDALALLPRCGIPAQNVLLASEDGRVAWTVAGRLPRRVGCDGRVPWDSQSDCWQGLVDPDSIPRVVRTPEGELWSANARALFGSEGRVLGDASYSLGARARQIRDALRTLQDATASDLLAIQLDDRALFLAPWREMLLERLSDPEDPLRDAVEDWGARASVESAGYRIVRSFRYELRSRLLSAWLEPAGVGEWDVPRQVEAAVFAALRERPEQLLPAGVASWDALLDAAVDAVRLRIPGDPDDWRWGDANHLDVGHPLAAALGPLGRRLRLPAVAMPGDSYMPRVQRDDFGASNRFVVSPGHEADGILHLPGGVSGHPLSPYFAAGHQDWVAGRPTPFLPGETEHRLRLLP